MARFYIWDTFASQAFDSLTPSEWDTWLAMMPWGSLDQIYFLIAAYSIFNAELINSCH